jgi:hypothetical protein
MALTIELAIEPRIGRRAWLGDMPGLKPHFPNGNEISGQVRRGGSASTEARQWF